MLNSKLFSDFFPIQTDKLPPLYAYEIIGLGGDKKDSVGGKLSYRLRKMLSGNWVWSNHKLISSTQKSEVEFREMLSMLRKNEPDTFGNLHKVIPMEDWQPSAEEIAGYVAKGSLSNRSSQIRQILRKYRVDLDKAYVERDYKIKGWSIQGEPAISISISSSIIYKQDLVKYAQMIDNSDDLIGIWVKVKTRTSRVRLSILSGLWQNIEIGYWTLPAMTRYNKLSRKLLQTSWL